MSLNTLKALRVGRIAKRENRCGGRHAGLVWELAFKGHSSLSVLWESRSVESPVVVRPSWCEMAHAGGGETRQRSAEAPTGREALWLAAGSRVSNPGDATRSA